MTADPYNNDEDELFAQEVAGESAVRTLFAIVHNRFGELEQTNKISQQQLANRMGLTRSQISRWFASPSNMTLRSAAKLLAAMDRKLELCAADPLALQMSAVTPQGQAAATSGEHSQKFGSTEREAELGNVIPFQPRWRVPTQPVFASAGPQRAAAADGHTESGADIAGFSAPRRPGGNISEIPPAPPAPVEIGEFTVPQGALRLLFDNGAVLVELSDDEPARLLFLGDGRYELQASSKWPGAFEVVGLSDDEADAFLEAHRRVGARAGWV
jgi:transcriptional regulator with XRE-family HTH domain